MFESERIDRQLYGRASRQGDPGSAVALVSLEDPLIKRNLGLTMKLFKYLCVPFGRKIRVPGVRLVFFIAQKLSVFKGRRQRKGVMKSDTWLEDNLGFAGKEHT
jgi:preprotein translocase subunit SecA